VVLVDSAGRESAWWSDALHDPWRDPASTAEVVSQVPQSPPPVSDLPTPLRPRAGIGLMLTVAAVSALLAGALGGALGYVAASRNGTGGSTVIGARPTGPLPALAQRPPESMAGVVARVMPGVVTVHAEAEQGQSLGSGFVITADGYVVTNEHVVADVADEVVRVTFSNHDTATARVVGRDVESDLAVLKVSRGGLQPVELGDSDTVAVGDPVLAIGSPLALSGTVTFGIVSAVDRTITGGDAGGPQRYYAAIQTDAAVNHGNSGGPLFDAAGRVIGINSMIKSLAGSEDESGNIGLAFAIPINQGRRIAGEIIDSGKARRTVIGAALELGYRGNNGGARLRDVEPAGPADAAGLRDGDVILRLGSHSIEEPTDLIALVRRYDPGTVLNVTYRRGGATQTTQVTLVADAN
jgi:putative serine protease PepD